MKPLPDATAQQRNFINTHAKKHISVNVKKWQLYAYQLQYCEGIFLIVKIRITDTEYQDNFIQS